MAITCTKLPDKHYAEYAFTPPLVMDELYRMRDEFTADYASGRIRGCLMDASRMEVQAASIIDMAKYPATFDMAKLKGIRFSVILPENAITQEVAYFVIQMARLLGVDIRGFFAEERDAARRWIEQWTE